MALLAPGILTFVVALGATSAGQEPDFFASGFLWGEEAQESSEAARKFAIYLVTNRHVLEGRDDILLRVNPRGEGSALELTLQLRTESGVKRWSEHPDPAVDVAVAQLAASKLVALGAQFGFFTSSSSLTAAEIAERGIGEGDGVFVLGFPLGLVGANRNAALVRQGIVARIQDALRARNQPFLIDSTVFPGNSGGPVVTRGEILSRGGGQPFGSTALIGMVQSYIPYQETAQSPQTGRPRVLFEENSGLAKVVLVDRILEVVELEKRRIHG